MPSRAGHASSLSAGPMTASLVGTSGFAAIPTTALDLPLVQRLQRSPRFRVRVPITNAAKIAASPGAGVDEKGQQAARARGPLSRSSLAPRAMAVSASRGICYAPTDRSKSPHSRDTVIAVWRRPLVGMGLAPRPTPGSMAQPTSSRTTLNRMSVLPRARASASPRPTDQDTCWARIHDSKTWRRSAAAGSLAQASASWRARASRSGRPR